MCKQTKYVLYGSMKNRGGRVIWALEELEQTYELVDLKLFEGEQRTPDFQAINPHGKVPALIIHDLKQDSSEVVTESLAILYVLAERHQSLLPPLPQSRALCHHWLAYCATELEPPLWMHAKHTFVYAKKRRVEDILPTCIYEYQRALNHIETILSDGRDYILEDGFSLADIYVGQTLMWGRSRSMGTLSDYTEAYIKRLKGRPAWRRAIASSGPKENT